MTWGASRKGPQKKQKKKHPGPPSYDFVNVDGVDDDGTDDGNAAEGEDAHHADEEAFVMKTANDAVFVLIRCFQFCE